MEGAKISDADVEDLSTKVQEFREQHQLPITMERRKFRDLWYRRSKDLYFMDLETACGSVDGFEICVWDVSGYPIIDEIINYSTADCPCTIRQLYGRHTSVLDQGVIRKVYGPPSDTTTPGKIWDEVADRLSIHFGPQTHLVEWSNGKFVPDATTTTGFQTLFSLETCPRRFSAYLRIIISVPNPRPSRSIGL